MIRRLWRSILRDYFAAQAMKSKMVSPLPAVLKDKYAGLSVAQYLARQSYSMADAMLEERDRATAQGAAGLDGAA